MNKQDTLIVVALFALLIGWTFFQRAHQPPPTEEPPISEMTNDVATVRAGGTASNAVRNAASSEERPVALDANTNALAPEAIAPAASKPHQPEQRIVLTNGTAELTLSSWGGCVTAAQLDKYRTTVDEDSGPVILDFADRPALSLEDAPGFTRNDDFWIVVSTNGRSATLTATNETGVVLQRTIDLLDGYRVDLTDTFTVLGDSAVQVPKRGVVVGPMQLIRSRSKTRGISYLGIDTMEDKGGADVEYWGKKRIPALFGQRSSMLSCARQPATDMPPTVQHTIDSPISWVAAKNKYFVQLLAPDKAGVPCELQAARDMEEPSHLTLATVSAKLLYPEEPLLPGAPRTYHLSYYVGPKLLSALKHLPNRQSDVMQFGWWSWFRGLCYLLLSTLNGIYAVLPNYGLAIILLTVIVKIIFWPVTHKSTESMKKMQEIQPQVTALREKYKDNPQKLQQETMLLYRQNKVNPLAGCLPMLVQIPVFIALFTVLRSAIELRFAGFLWIPDLSEPEGLLQGFPIIGSLNILPIFMAATMAWQQHLTPSGGDPQQKRMMMLMPAFMLLLFYNMASALVLYWSVSQVLSIVQLIRQRKNQPTADASKAATPPSALTRKISGGKGRNRRNAR